MPKAIKESTKANVIIAIQHLIRDKSVGTQEEICQALEEQGLTVNQVKVSRILHKMGAIKMNEGDRVVYRLPTEMTKVTPKDTLKRLIISIRHNESLIVIQSAPGAAQLVARLLDIDHNEDVLGTVAGDDTIFVAPITIKKVQSVYEHIYKMLLD
jgi:transcriptional regulator of arginine metabolism